MKNFTPSFRVIMPWSKTLSSKVISWFPMMIKVTSLFCNICNQTFPNFSKKKIFYHQKYHQYIQHKCAQCDFITDNSELLEFHIRKSHLYCWRQMFKLNFISFVQSWQMTFQQKLENIDNSRDHFIQSE